MGKPGKLKTSSWGVIIFTLLLVAVLICCEIFFGKETFYTVLCVMPLLAALAHFVSFLRTKNWGYLIPMLFYVFIIIIFFAYIISITYNRLWTIILASCAGILFIGEMCVLYTKRINWRYREILELAANPVDESADGFTPRPFPAGEAKYTKEEIIRFTKFMIKHVIAYPFVEKNRVVLWFPKICFPICSF